MDKRVDSYRFVDRLTARALHNWALLEPQRTIPWSPLIKPLEDCTLALVSTAAIALNSDPPFDLEIERRNPWFSDPSYRIIPRQATEQDVQIYHLHIDKRFAQQDLNCIFPLRHLEALESIGEIGSLAPRHYAYMGYTCQPEPLLRQSVPGMIRDLKQDAVDAVILIPV